jgi:DNA-binding XRE family transcriptional regulator
MGIDIINQDGRERVVLDRSDYEDLIDARDAAIAMREIAAGAPTIPDSEMDAYLAAPTPLAFWRQRAAKTQAALADEVGVSQPFLAQIEGGQRQGTVRVLARLAKSLGVRIEDLIP